MATDRTNAERQRRFIARLKEKAAQAAQAPVTNGGDNAGLAKELAQAKARITELEDRGPAKAGADVAQSEDEIAALRDENYRLRVELEARNHVIKTRDGGGVTSAQFRMLQMLGHPDNPLSEKKKGEAIRLINQLRYVLCNEAELPSMDPRKFDTMRRRLWKERQGTIKEAKKRANRRRTPARAAAKASPPKPIGHK